MRVLSMAGRMLPENHVNAKSSAAIRAEDAARDRRAAAEPSPAQRANGLAVAETLNRLAQGADATKNLNVAKNVATHTPAPIKQETRGSLPFAGPAARGSLPSAGPGSTLPKESTQSLPPVKQLPARPTQPQGNGAKQSNEAPKATTKGVTDESDTLKAVLPAGWTAHKDPDTNLTYYYHATTGTSSWEFPAEKAGAADFFQDCKEPEQEAAATSQTPAQTAGAAATTSGGSQQLGGGWSEHLDPDSGITYFYHAASGKSQWERPTEEQQR